MTSTSTPADEFCTPEDGTRYSRSISANLARGVPCAHLLLYPDAGHAFLSQDAEQFIPAVERFLS